MKRCEFHLASRGSKQAKEWWYVESFLTLTHRDLSRWISITNVAGIPIALDGSKGTCYLPWEAFREQREAPVLLQLPGRKKENRKVASSFEESVKLEAKNVPAED